MSTPQTPAGSRKTRVWIVLSMLVVVAGVLIAVPAMRGDRGVEAERSVVSDSATAPPPPPVIPTGSDLAPGAKPTRVGGTGRALSSDEAATRVRIHGRVTASEPGPAIVGTVAVQRWIDKKKFDVAKVALDSDGRYDAGFALDPPAGTAVSDEVSVFVVTDAWAPRFVWVVDTRAGEYERDVILEPGKITGRVVDEAGREVAGLDLRAVDWLTSDDLVDMPMLEPELTEGREGAFARTVTDAHGRFEFRGLRGGGSRLFSASLEWFARPVKARPGDADVEVVVGSAISISGVVRDARSRDPVEATAFLSRMRTTHAGATTKTTYQEFTAGTHAGRFQFIMPVPAAGPDIRYAVRAVPLSRDFTESPRLGPFEPEMRHHEVELLVERSGSGVLVLDATTPGGAAFDGPLEVVLLPRGWQGGQRESTAVLERAGRYRISVPADRDWDAVLTPIVVSFVEAPISTVSVRMPVRVREGGEITAQAVFPRFGRLLLQWSGAGVSVKVESLDPTRAGSLINEMPPGSAPPPAGIRNMVPEGRYRVSVVGGPPRTSREVEVKADEETVVDLR